MEPIIIQLQLAASEPLLSAITKIAEAVLSNSRAVGQIISAGDAQAEAEPKTAQAPHPISDPELREAVKAANRREGVGPSAVRQVFSDFGISTSIDCPQSRRAELLNALNALGAEGNAK